MSDSPDPPAPVAPLMSYASHVAAGTGRTPIGIILFAASHLLLGGVLMLAALLMSHRARDAQDWAGVAAVAVLGVPMLPGGVALLLKGRVAWTAAVMSFFVLTVMEAATLAYAVGMTCRYAIQGNHDVQLAAVFASLAFCVAVMGAVVVGYLGGEKARATFGLPPGEAPVAVRYLRPIVLTLYALALITGPMLVNVRAIFPD
jgi:hypothetical protein